MAGYAAPVLLYGLLLLPISGLPVLIVSLALVGLAAAARDGVPAALASASLPQTLQGSGLALLTTMTGIGQLLASMLFGALWTFVGVDTTVGLFLVGLVGATGLAWVMLRANER